MKENSKINICFISYRDPFEIVLDNFSKALLDQGKYEITLLGSSNKDSKPFIDDFKRKIVKLPLPNNLGISRRKLLFALKVTKFLKNNEFKIIHLDNSCRYFGLIKLLSRSNSKFIFHILSYPVTNSNFIRLRKMIMIYLQCFLVDKVIIQSDEIKKRWVGLNFSKKAIVIPVGFDKKLFFPIHPKKIISLRKKLGISEDMHVIIYSGVISKQRNLDVLINSVPMISKSHKNIKLILIGSGKAEKILKEQVKVQNIENYVIFTGRVYHEDVVNYLALADIAISFIPINDSYNYNPPLKTFEYLACGLPTIATNTISNKVIIKNNLNGILIDDNANEICNAVIELLENPNKRSTLSYNARGSILNYDYGFITKNELIPLYNTLLI